MSHGGGGEGFMSHGGEVGGRSLVGGEEEEGRSLVGGEEGGSLVGGEEERSLVGGEERGGGGEEGRREGRGGRNIFHESRLYTFSMNHGPHDTFHFVTAYMVRTDPMSLS